MAAPRGFRTIAGPRSAACTIAEARSAVCITRSPSPSSQTAEACSSATSAISNIRSRAGLSMLGGARLPNGFPDISQIAEEGMLGATSAALRPCPTTEWNLQCSPFRTGCNSLTAVRRRPHAIIALTVRPRNRTRPLGRFSPRPATTGEVTRTAADPTRGAESPPAPVPVPSIFATSVVAVLRALIAETVLPRGGVRVILRRRQGLNPGS